MSEAVDGEATTLLTVGHGAQSADDLGALLRAAAVALVVDVRIAPGSRRHPQFDAAALAQWLPGCGVAYRGDRRLGGFRRPPPDSPDVALRNDAFRGYAAWMREPEFTAAMADLLADAVGRRTAVMCSETVWWRCHRRLVADHASLLGGVDVVHLMPGGRHAPHQPTAGVRCGDGELVYDVLTPPPR